jgi:2'-hydroxyisoflavone reductase
MKILILGGTQFIGRHMVQELLAGGHRVSILNRGQSPDDLPPQVERLRGDRDAGIAGLDAVMGRTWDVCVDVSGYTPRQVRPAAERLCTAVQRYIFISAVSVYGDPDTRPVRETHPRLPPAHEDVTDITSDTYGSLKVACENIVHQIYGDRCTLLRPQVVVGPNDPRGRLTYWVQRARQGGEMLAPGDGFDHIQVIDARDLARFTRTVIETDLRGSFNLAGLRLTWAAFMHVLGAQHIIWVPADIISAAGLTFLDLPLFRPEHGPRSSLMDVSNTRAQAAGLTLTDIAITVRDVQAWLHGRSLPLALAPAREAALIRVARQRIAGHAN